MTSGRANVDAVVMAAARMLEEQRLQAERLAEEQRLQADRLAHAELVRRVMEEGREKRRAMIAEVRLNGDS